MPSYRKSSPAAPARYFAWEAAGLRWLAGAHDEALDGASDGAPVVEVLDVGPGHLELVRLESATPTRAAAQRFGAALARTHRAGAAAYGSGPPGWVGDGFFGPLSHPLALPLRPCTGWAEHLADNLLRPVTRACRDAGVVDATGARLLDEVAARAGRFDTGEPPARIHGDLWSGNLMWTPGGATLIDPAAHGGHREADLAMLALFGAPHLQACFAAYQTEWPLDDGWRARVGLHQLYPLAVHALLFGGGYAERTLDVAKRVR
jgi:fructosamine-3-kinase